LTQFALLQWVEEVESELIQGGIPVIVRRQHQAPFHCTLATISGDYSNATSTALSLVNGPTGMNGTFNADTISITSFVWL